ncbi:hypothetical protein [Micromonospora sp. NBRC 101691]|uniref:hypothetical protein n=1 Tax=Micromonospora sp. NBRC 101691 TaxID=3032198 RepID=UPI002554B246|nr:hypothetical protein [Micromonospora sp. NBRC 101691]
MRPLRTVVLAAGALVAVAATPAGALPTPVAAPPPVPVVASAPTPVVAASSAPVAPTVTLDRAEARPGGRVLVRLAGWPAGTVVIEVCGTGPAGCAVDSSVQTHLAGSGLGGAALTTAVPPGGCPCQVRVTTLDRRLTAAAPLALTGDAGARPAPTADHRATHPPLVTAVTVERDRGWWSRLGGPARHTLVVRLRNDGTAPASVTMSLTVGRGDDPSGFVPPPAVPDLAVGEERAVRVPVSLPALAFGTWTVEGRVVTAGVAAPFRASVESRPWGPTALLGVAVVVLLAVELLRRRPRTGPARPAERPGGTGPSVG